jgi:hypothetical protein
VGGEKGQQSNHRLQKEMVGNVLMGCPWFGAGIPAGQPVPLPVVWRLIFAAKASELCMQLWQGFPAGCGCSKKADSRTRVLASDAMLLEALCHFVESWAWIPLLHPLFIIVAA